MHLKNDSSMPGQQQGSLEKTKLPTLHSFFTADNPCVMPCQHEEPQDTKVSEQEKKASKP